MNRLLLLLATSVIVVLTKPAISGAPPDPKTILREAAEWAARIEDKSGQASIWGWIGKEQIKLGERKAAFDSFKRAFDASKDVKDYKANYLLSLVHLQAEAGEISAAFESAEELSKFNDEAYSNLRAQAWGAITSAQARAGDIQAALTNIQNIDEPATDNDHWKNLALEEIAHAQVKAGDTNAGVKTAQSIPDLSPRVHCLTSIARLRYRADKADGRKILKLPLEEPKSASDDDYGRFVQVDIIHTRAAMGEFEEANRLVDKLPEPERFQALALYYIAVEQAKAKDVPGALKTARAIPRGTTRDTAFAEIAPEQPLADALKTLEGVHYDYFRAESLWTIGQREAKAGRKREAEEIFQEAYRVAERIKDPPNFVNTKIAVLRDLARAQAQAGFSESARRWIDRQTSAEVRALALVGLVQGLTSR